MEIVKQRNHFSTTDLCRKSAHLMAFSSRKVHLFQRRNSEHQGSMGFGRLQTADTPHVRLRRSERRGRGAEGVSIESKYGGAVMPGYGIQHGVGE